MRAIFRNCRLIGRRFRLAHVFFRDGKIIEVATFRQNPVDVGDDVPSDADLLITRDNVFGTAEEDARRRDFTVNGLFYDPFQGEVIDYVGGRADLEAHRISTIGDPEIRMREDPVRALRAIRFASRLGFTIEPEVFEAMRRHAGELARCAPPRVLEETFRDPALHRGEPRLRAAPVRRAAPGGAALALPGPRRRRPRGADSLPGPPRPRSTRSSAEARRSPMPCCSAPCSCTSGPARAGTRPADLLLAELVQTARLPRRMAERTRMALQAQKLFHGPPRRRRRGGLAGQAYFHRRPPAPPGDREGHRPGCRGALARWEDEAQRREGAGAEEIEPSLLAEATGDAAPGSGATPVRAAEGDPEGRTRRAARAPSRRRRGGRRRRRRGRGGGGSAQATPPATPGAPVAGPHFEYNAHSPCDPP